MGHEALILFAGLTLCLIALPVDNDAARILGVFPAPSKSHLLIHCALADALAQAGHDVTVITPMPNLYPAAKYKHIRVDVEVLGSKFVNDMVNKPHSIYRRFSALIGEIAHMTSDMLAHPSMQQFLRDHDESSFDLLLLNNAFIEFHYGLIAHFRCPAVISFMVRPISSINALAGNPQEISYVPTLFSGLKQPLSFVERVQNFLHTTIETYFLGSLVKYHSWKNYAKHFPSNLYPPLDAVKKNISLIFINHHFSQGPIAPNVPGIIEIGGIQIKEKTNPLPEDIAQVLDNAKEGAIYFSLGTIAQGSNVSMEKIKIIFNVLSKLPYKVLWKWSDTILPGNSSNIIFKSWLPQDDILAHPNIKLFITHCGQGSVVESQYHGVPMVGIPLFGDQPSNMANVHRAGFGLPIDYRTMTEESLRSAVLEVLQNPKYTQAVKQFSQLYRDRPLTARQNVLYWVEYVLRHNGAKHLQSPAVFMSSWQLMSLDVLGFLFILIAVVVLGVVKLCQLCCRGRKGKTNCPVSKTKKNK